MTRIQWHPAFAEASHTLQCEERDYIEWHQGRRRYAIWAIEVEDAEWLGALHSARQQLNSVLLAGEPRRAHITLFAIGFTEDAQYESLLSRQTELLQEQNLSAFELQLAGINSFTSAPYLAVHDASSRLAQINSLLPQVSSASWECPYTPHLTIGLYNQRYTVKAMQSLLGGCEIAATPPMIVRRLSLMHYDTRSLFSPLHTEMQITLDATLTE